MDELGLFGIIKKIEDRGKIEEENRKLEIIINMTRLPMTSLSVWYSNFFALLTVNYQGRFRVKFDGKAKI